MNRIIICLICLLVARAEAFDRVGTASAQFLKLGVGARELAMGGCGVTATGSVSTGWWNPSGVQISHFGFSWQYGDYYANLTHMRVGAGMALDRNTSVVWFANMLQAPEQEVTTVREPDGNGLNYSYQGLSTGLIWTRRLTDRLHLGCTGKLVREQLYHESASTFALDAGIRYEFAARRLLIGGAIANFGNGMKLSGTDLLLTGDVDSGIDGNHQASANLETEEWPLPLTFRFGSEVRLLGSDRAFYIHPDHQLLVAVSAEHPNDNAERLGTGIEYGFRHQFFLRSGYRFNTDTEGLTLGCGFALNTRGRGSMRLDYVWREYGDLGDVSSLSVGWKW